MKELAAIERVAAPSPAEFRARYLEPQRPVILEGMIADWPAMARWRGEALVEHYGEVPVNALGRWTTIREVVADIRAGTDVFADFTLAQAPVFSRDLRPLPYVAVEDITFVNLWMGGARRTNLHFDALENLHAVVRGTKTFYLIAPDQHARLYHVVPEADRPKTLSYTQLAFFELDEARFPATRDVGFHVAELRPGDTLYLPACWYHAVQHAGDPTLAINYWWAPAAPAGPVADSFVHDRTLLAEHYGDARRTR